MSNKARQFYDFGPYRIDPRRRMLLRQQHPLTLHPKAFEVLLVLVQNSERVVTKDDLMKMVWPDSFVEESNLSQQIFVLRKTLGDAVEEKRYIVTVPGRGYRFVEKVNVVEDDLVEPEVIGKESADGADDFVASNVTAADVSLVVESHTRSRVVVEEREVPAAALWAKSRLLWFTVSVAVLVALVAAAVLLTIRRRVKLTERDTIVLADFDNRTGDPVFDGALRQGLAAQLAQSPFLNLLSDSSVAQTLVLMGHAKDEPLTPRLAQEICQRTQSAAALDGSIAQFGARYQLTLRAIACSNGELLASTEAQASDKNHVLEAMGIMAATIRSKLGESLASVEKYDVPQQNVTTRSLEALRAYSLAMKNRNGNSQLPIELFKRAIELDPNFAMAYAQLGVIYVNIGEPEQGAQIIRKAYELRGHVSELEKLYIASHYDDLVNGDLVAARKDYELWEQIYPHDRQPYAGLTPIYYFTGNYEKILPAVERNAELGRIPADQPNIGIIWSLTFLNRIDEAKALALKGQAATHDPLYDLSLYQFAYLQRDEAARKHELEILADDPTWGDGVLYDEVGILVDIGQFAKSREFLQRAVDAAIKRDKKESAASYKAQAALAEVLAGNSAQAKQYVKEALALSDSKDIRSISALTLSLSGDSTQATKMADDLGKRYPKNTIIQSNFLPTIRAAALLWNGKPDPQKSIQLLATTTPYEKGVTALDNGICFYPVFVRGQAYLTGKQGPAAVAEFHKILDYPQIVQMEPLGFMAHLGLARAYALTGDSAKSRAEYQNFLTLWKNADANIPVLREAKAEYAKLR
jgi:eukaryotic-like serine/threonine-protein kinase